MQTLSQTSKNIIEQYVFGSSGRPQDIVSDALIRSGTPTDDTAQAFYQMNLAEYMNGPGRFARGSMSSLVDQFFRPNNYNINGNPLPTLTAQSYSKRDLAALYKNDNYGIRFQQYNYSDSVDDYAERTYLWNSTAIKLSESADLRFVVAADGTRYIENFALVPIDNENFDFKSGNIVAQLTAEYSQNRMDSSRIGRRVDISFKGTPQGRTYTIDDFNNDLTFVQQAYQILPSPSLFPDVNAILREVWDTGITAMLDQQGRPVIFGTRGGDLLSYDSYKLTDNPYLQNHLGVGLTVVGGAGNDGITGTSQNDRLLGGDQNDDISGGRGTDEIIGGNGDDVLDSAEFAQNNLNGVNTEGFDDAPDWSAPIGVVRPEVWL